ncbi:MAG: T9SS type A sorting domain-containing protein, partial [Candidatus Cloacimonetes bacterium]|nr:T9SS type A sorting domain-containing protein [Candidatus Cloacimonadota bacterium]
AVTTPVSPADGATLEWPFGTADQPVTLEWNAVAGVTGYKLAWNGTPAQDLGNVLTFNTPPIGEGSYIWQVIPYITDPVAKGGKRSLAPVGARVAMNAPKGDAVEAPLWHFTINVLDPVVHNLVITSDPAGATILLGGVATENITPFTVTEAGTYSVMMDGYTFLPEDYIWDGAADDEIEFVGTLIPTYDVIPGVPEELDPATDVTITGAGFIGANLVTEGYTPVPNPTFVATSEGILQLVGTGEVSLTFDFDPAVDWFVYLEGGEWIAVAGPLTTYTVIVDLGAKDGTFEYKAGSGEDPTLPVELSVFNATLTAQNFVKLSWTSESETNMLGYRVYRAESEVQAEAILITPIMIQATNTSTTQNYSIEDREVNIGTTYYYWLEAVDYSHSSFFGHRSVEVLGEITPELPVQSVMSNAYPNPFRASSNTTIEVKVRADETGTVTIYNVLGQAVKTYTVSEGNHKLTWNGRDSRGNLCGSGIYFARMSTPSMNQTKKMVIVK